MIQPRDIITPSATLVAVVLTAFGILHALAGESVETRIIIKNLSLIFIVVVVLLVCAVVLTLLSSLLRNHKLLSAAMIVNIFAWAFLGTVTIFTLVGYGFGIEMLQVQLPQFSGEMVISLSVFVGLILSGYSFTLFAKQIYGYRERISELLIRLEAVAIEITDVTKNQKHSSTDMKLQLENLRAEIENRTIELAKLYGVEKKTGGQLFPLARVVYALTDKKVLSSELASSIIFVEEECDKVNKGMILFDKDALLILKLALKTIQALEELKNRKPN